MPPSPLAPRACSASVSSRSTTSGSRLQPRGEHVRVFAQSSLARRPGADARAGAARAWSPPSTTSTWPSFAMSLPSRGISFTVPARGAVTVISIFIDSRSEQDVILGLKGSARRPFHAPTSSSLDPSHSSPPFLALSPEGGGRAAPRASAMVATSCRGSCARRTPSDQSLPLYLHIALFHVKVVLQLDLHVPAHR